MGANGFVVGGTFYEGGGFHWMPTGGVVPIGGVDTVDVSRDGKVFVGSALDANRRQAGRDLDRRHELAAAGLGRRAAALRPLISSALGTNDDGRVVVGLAWDGCSYARAFRWEESTGMVDLGSLGGRVHPRQRRVRRRQGGDRLGAARHRLPAGREVGGRAGKS